jgi:isochorismate hydrolase
VSDEYLCLTVQSRPGEAESDFKARLSQFWTGMLRNFPDQFEKVYAETVQFESDNTQLRRQYLFESSVANLLEEEMRKAGVDHEPIDRDDVYSKYEATPPEWMWIEH